MPLYAIHFYEVSAEEAAVHEFVVQRQEPPGPDDRHITWISIDRVFASDLTAAITTYTEAMGWESVGVSGSWFFPYGLGRFRMVPAAEAEDVSYTPAP
jgi:hypothetical protein